jgi:hypothetical protein
MELPTRTYEEAVSDLRAKLKEHIALVLAPVPKGQPTKRVKAVPIETPTVRHANYHYRTGVE